MTKIPVRDNPREEGFPWLKFSGDFSQSWGRRHDSGIISVSGGGSTMQLVTTYVLSETSWGETTGLLTIKREPGTDLCPIWVN